uniref:Chromosome 2 open reading frame 15 n=1 Tax=Saimiri boliviensis boliviensis TaxID=39432 RepID=A0A2K6SZL7_SAIBB
MSSTLRNLSNQVEETFPLLKKVPPNYFHIYSAIPMGFSLSKSATQVSAMHMDSKVDDHLLRGTEKSRLEPMTRLFQNTKKIGLEDTNQENVTRIEGTGTGSLSEKALGSVVYVKENDGLEVTDVE